jgi:serine/threonine protein kinase
MIHGDLKPENVLIFNSESGGYAAKVADFGYSGISLERAEDAKFHLPVSQPWNAPEVTKWNSVLVLSAARNADIYSFGLLCLWTLFHDRFPTPSEECDDTTDDLDWIQALKDKDLLFSFAMECMENTESLREEDIEGLVLFFSWTLADESISRQLPNEVHTAAESMFFKQKNAEPFATVEDEAAFQYKLGGLSSIGIQCKDMQGHIRPFGYLQYASPSVMKC